MQDDRQDEPAVSDELDGGRIRQIAQMRRSAYRSRSYCLIAAVGLLVGTVQLVYLAIQHMRSAGWGVTPMGYLLLAGFGPYLAVRFYRRAQAFGAEAARSTLQEPEQTPDFSGLSDGSHQWQNLRDIQ